MHSTTIFITDFTKYLNGTVKYYILVEKMFNISICHGLFLFFS